MKTIAVSIDESTLAALERVIRKGARRARGSRRRPTRSEVVRQALHEFIERHERSAREAKERQLIARHRDRLAREAAALVKEQARL